MFFWDSLAFLMIQQMLTIWSLVPLPFLKPACTSGSTRFMYHWSLAWRILPITLLACAAAAAAKSLQSCLTLCDPIDGSSPGSLIPGILQARRLEWVAISFSNAWKGKVKVKLCWEPAWGNLPMAKVMRKEAWHTQRRDQASGNHLFPSIYHQNQSLFYALTYTSDFTASSPPSPFLCLEPFNFLLLLE